MKMKTHTHLMLRLRMSGTLHPAPRMPWWSAKGLDLYLYMLCTTQLAYMACCVVQRWTADEGGFHPVNLINYLQTCTLCLLTHWNLHQGKIQWSWQLRCDLKFYKQLRIRLRCKFITSDPSVGTSKRSSSLQNGLICQEWLWKVL
jgi:hypothetical protein